MSAQRLRVGVIGAGRVFQRLYQPAIERIAGLVLVAGSDPSCVARERLHAAVSWYDTPSEMMGSERCDAVIVLSPGPLHASHAALVLAESIPVLLEKPSAMAWGELESWPPEWRALMCPARPRRYWPRYLELRRQLAGGAPFKLSLQTSPLAWDASEMAAPIDDLLPHVIDLAGWLSNSCVQRISGEILPDHARGMFHLADGGSVEWSVKHADIYDEYVDIGRQRIRLDTMTFREKLDRRLRRLPSQDVQGVTRMLRLWERQLRGEVLPSLPGFETAAQETRFRDELRMGRGL